MSSTKLRTSRSRLSQRGPVAAHPDRAPARRPETGAVPNLAGALSSFLGRDEELAELAGLLERSGLVTLTGAPGVGKTRLARELAMRHPDRAALVDLAPISDPALVPRAVASALSVAEVSGQGLVETLVAHLRRRRVLIVLDNCEHLLGVCAQLVGSFLGNCPEVLVLATSREALGLRMERVWQLAPLAVPDRGLAPLPEALIDYPAVSLFLERASAVQPGFALHTYVASAVAEICRRLDGIPLAIELAASRVDMLTPAEIAQRLDDRFGLLTKPSVNGLASHPTLQAALDWSHELLSPAQRTLLRRLSIFAGGFDLEAAKAICAGGRVKAGTAPKLLDALVSKSLVAIDADASSHARYRLLETIRAYASDQLEAAGEAATLREAHARFYLTLAETAEPELTGPDQVLAFERLELERDNLRAAVEWSLGHAHGDWALRLTGALVLFWRVRCRFGEGRELLEAALSASEDQTTALRAKALWGAGFLTLMAGDPHGAVPALEQSLSSFRERNDLQGSARALLILANCNQSRPQASVLSLLEESAALARQAGDSWCLAHALAVAGFEHAHDGEFPAARVVFEEGLAVARESHDDQGMRFSLNGLGSVALAQGDYRAAETLLQEALAIAGELDEDYSKAQALQYLGWLALDRGDRARARALLEEALALIPEVAPVNIAICTLMLVARVAHAAGDRSDARQHFDEVLAHAGPAPPVFALQWMGELSIDEGDMEEGRRLLEAALAVARGRGQKHLMAQALHGLGRLARDAGEARRAVALDTEAIELQRQIGAAPGTVASIEALAGLAASAGCHRHAARLLGAASTQRQEIGCVRLRWESAGYEADLALVRAGLGTADFEAAFLDGGKLSLGDAVVLACKGAGRRGRPSTGWASMTERQQQVAELAAEGLTNPEIAERLVVARATVKRHLWEIFLKLGVTRRGELLEARDAWRRNGGAGLTRDSD